ncbi:MAG: hypothetical protein KDJ73_01445 [Notoacmeibacter sp.]|nr:hypothetical protein [Notoacmeibacter sp.]
MFAATIGACAILFAAVWTLRDDPANKPYLTIAGGGFVFNYRVSEVFYGFTALVARPLETGSIIEASFSTGQDRTPAIVRQRVGTETRRYALRSPALAHVVKGAPYDVTIRVLDRSGNNELWRTEKRYVSQISSEGLIGSEPLTVGPGYMRNPNARK